MGTWILRTAASERGTPAHFAGWPALVARVRAECIAIDADARLSPDDVRGARLVVTTNAVDAVLAAPVVYAARRAGDVPPGVRPVQPETFFRRDLTLDSLLDAIESAAPGLVERPRPFAALVPLLVSQFGGDVAHIAHGGAKVAPHAIGFDLFRADLRDHVADPRELWCCDAQRFDTVVLSPDWLTLRAKRHVLAEALRIARCGGRVLVAAAPRDVEALLPRGAELTGVLDAASGTAVVEKRAARSWFHTAAERAQPQASVLIVGEVRDPAELEVPRLRASILAAHASLGDLPHEILVLLRQHPGPEALADLHELAATMPECRIDVDLSPLQLPDRFERLRRSARGAHLIVLASGTLPRGDALRALCERAGNAPLAFPRLVDPGDRELSHRDAPGCCVRIARGAWPEGLLVRSEYGTHELWNAWADEVAVAHVADAVAVTAGWSGRALRGMGPGLLAFDRALRARSVDVTVADTTRTDAPRILVVALRSMGDCVLATAPLEALRERAPHAVITVLTEHRYEWIFRHHAAVDAVLRVHDLADGDLFWQEQELIAAAVGARDFDELIVLSDRLDNTTYPSAGLPFAAFYAVQARVPSACERAFVVAVTDADRAVAREALHAHGVHGDYAVVHMRAGWPERTPPRALFDAVRAEVCDVHDLPLVIVGGAGERLDGHGVVNLAGAVGTAASAAIIGGAALFVGPDSGSMHIASSFDVPTLGLYGGTSLRLVPPQATRAAAVQATTSCPLPCGKSPCASGCGARGIEAAHVRALVATLLEGGSPHREWFGSAPACVVAGPAGDVVVQTSAPPAAEPRPARAVARARAMTGARTARVHDLVLARDPARSALLQRDVLALRDLLGLRDGARGTARALPADAFAAPIRAACHHALALACIDQALPGLAAEYLRHAAASSGADAPPLALPRLFPRRATAGVGG